MFVKQRQNIRSEVLTAVNVKNTAFWNAIPCNLVGVYESSGGTNSFWFAACFDLFFDPEHGQYVPSKRE
jgi:hypothetical protein